MVDPFRKAKEAGLTTSLDTNDDPNNRWSPDIQLVFKYVDILLPNENEACQLAGAADFRQAAEILSKNVPLVVIKRGSQGAYARRGAEKFEGFRLPSPLSIWWAPETVSTPVLFTNSSAARVRRIACSTPT